MVLTAIAPDLWAATQPLRFLGLEVGSRMTVVRLPSGGLVLISPIELSLSDRQALDELGPVEHIIAPNLFHHLSLPSTCQAYPQAAVWGAPGLEQKRPEILFDHVFSATEPSTPEPLDGVIDCLPIQGFATVLPSGIKRLQETVLLHKPSRTLILTDTAFNFDEASSLGIRLLSQVLGSYQKLQPSPLEKWGSRGKDAVAASIHSVLRWDFDRVIPGHGAVVDTDGKAKLQAGYEQFLGRSL